MMDQSNALITVRNLRKSFGDVTVVEDLSFDVNEGDIVALLGRTGAGKSTVLNLVMGTIPPTGGSASVGGHDPYSEFKALRGRVAVSFQTDRLLPWRTAVENAELGLLILGVPKREARARALKWLDLVQLGGAEDRYVHELSGGMRQRVSLARALAVDPSVIFLDESFSQLDHATAKSLRTDFHRIVRDLGKTCLFVTHRIEDAVEIADRAIVLTTGAHIALIESFEDREHMTSAELSEAEARIAAVLGSDPAEIN
jgi:NitT/TauT family transport system ATP-binding protein